MAVRTRSRASLTASSGRPTTRNCGRPPAADPMPLLASLRPFLGRGRLAPLLALLLALPGGPAWAGEPVPPAPRAPLFGIVDGYRKPGDAADAGTTWDRVLFLWQQIQP